MSKRKPPEVKGAPANWLITYGDLVTLLLCFFVMLYALATVDLTKFAALAASFPGYTAKTADAGGVNDDAADKPGSRIVEADEPYDPKYAGAQKELTEMAAEFQIYLSENSLSDKVQVVLDDRHLKITLSDDILFDSSKAEIKPTALELLSKVADAIVSYPECDVEIEGHADDRPINNILFKNNWYLSCARASEVAVYFVETGGIDARRLIPVGYGEYRPVDTNDTPEGRSKNRRVEIKILSKYYSGEIGQ